MGWFCADTYLEAQAVMDRQTNSQSDNTTQGVLNDTHDRLIGLRRNDLDYLDKYNTHNINDRK